MARFHFLAEGQNPSYLEISFRRFLCVISKSIFVHTFELQSFPNEHEVNSNSFMFA